MVSLLAQREIVLSHVPGACHVLHTGILEVSLIFKRQLGSYLFKSRIQVPEFIVIFQSVQGC